MDQRDINYGLAKMFKEVLMDVMSVEQAIIAENGACCYGIRYDTF